MSTPGTTGIYTPPFRSLRTVVYSATCMAAVITIVVLLVRGRIDEESPTTATLSFSPFPTRWWSTTTTTTTGGETAMTTTVAPPSADGSSMKVTNSHSHSASHNTVSNSTQTHQSTHMHDGSIDPTSTTATTATTANSSPWSTPSNLSFSHDACSCWNSSATRECCQRAVISAHKFGIILKRKLFDRYSNRIDQSQFFAGRLIPGKQTLDYRHVGMVRHVMVALVSGYLYHQSGRECWLDPYGQPWDKDRNIDWEQQIKANLEQLPVAFRNNLEPYPPRNGRSICQYLQDEAEGIGMKVYMAVVYTLWYSGIIAYFEREQIRTEKMGIPSRTLLVCEEDVSDPHQQEQIFLRMMDWLYPGGHSFMYDPSVSSDFAAGNSTGATRSHATSHDPELRRRLLELAKRHDVEVFDGLFTKMNSYFHCAETLRF